LARIFNPRTNFFSHALLTTATLIMGGCGTVIPRVTPELIAIAEKREKTVNSETLERSRALYITRCSSCHSLNDPRDYTESEWPDWMHKMARKAKINATQEHELLLFVLAARDLPTEADRSATKEPTR
jgi:uncharacterized membrane protein